MKNLEIVYMPKQSAKYKLEEYDYRALREARQRIMIVYNYHYGEANARGVISRIETIVNKIDYLLARERKDNES